MAPGHDAATLHLPGAAPTPADARLRERSARERALPTAAALAVSWVLAPVVFLVPPHIPWAFLVLAAGLYIGVRQWRGTHVVERFRGECPRCGDTLELEEGSRVRLPLSVTCYACHRESVLHLEAGARAAPVRTDAR